MATRRPLIVNAAANQIQELTDADGLTGNGTIPVGGIIMWSGTIANIPSGYALCNGSNGTPDLRNRFIVGATSDASSGVTFTADTGVVSGAYAPGNTGGSVAHKLTTAELASHEHSVEVYARNFKLNGGNASAGFHKPAYKVENPKTTKVGGDHHHENRPPYYALAFIMRTA